MLGLGLSLLTGGSLRPYYAVVAAAFKDRVEADGGTVESMSCLKADLKVLNPIKPPAYTGLLNDYSGAAAAYSLRLLDNTYTGNAIKVRRASDNSEQDIAFVNNELDTASLESFCSGTDGVVTTWYDQSGNGFDMTQSTASSQPKIYDAVDGVVLENNKPTIYFGGGNDFLLNNDTISSASNYWVFYARNLRNDSGHYVFDTQTGRMVFEQTYVSAYFAGGFKGSAISDGNHLVHLELISPSSGAVYEDGVNTQSGLSYTQTAISSANAIGGRYFLGSNANINMQEFIIYNADQSSNRSGIETNINDFYSIY